MIELRIKIDALIRDHDLDKVLKTLECAKEIVAFKARKEPGILTEFKIDAVIRDHDLDKVLKTLKYAKEIVAFKVKKEEAPGN